MSESALQLIAKFRSLLQQDQHDVAMAILRSGSTNEPFGDDVLTELADRTFLSLDAEERNGQLSC